MKRANLVLGRPLASRRQADEQIGPRAGVPILGLDALASVSYGPEAALTVLMAAGAVGTRALGSITLAIGVLLALLFLSYRQTIAAYPNGGGAYTVAKENLGTTAG